MMFFIKKSDSDMIVVHIYVDGILFGSENQTICDEFVDRMKEEFEMSLMSQLNNFWAFKSNKLLEERL